MQDQIDYYQNRAAEYEAIYHKPERQSDLSKLKTFLEKEFSNQSIIEIACGTGYWTQYISKKANSILAIDINSAVLEIAKQKIFPNNNVLFQVQDLKSIPIPSPLFEGLFGGFIWSHIPRQELSDFIKNCLAQIRPGGQVVFIDNKYVEGSSTPILKQDEFGNTFQKRTLKNGQTYEIIKNFPNQDEIKKLINQDNLAFEWIEFTYYWILKIHL